MYIKTITYKRIHNLGNYESEHLEMHAELEEGEDAPNAAKKLKLTVEKILLSKTQTIDDNLADF